MTVRDRLNVGFDPDTLAELRVVAKALDIRVPHAVRRLVAYALLHMPHQWTPRAGEDLCPHGYTAAIPCGVCGVGVRPEGSLNEDRCPHGYVMGMPGVVCGVCGSGIRQTPDEVRAELRLARSMPPNGEQR